MPSWTQQEAVCQPPGRVCKNIAFAGKENDLNWKHIQCTSRQTEASLHHSFMLDNYPTLSFLRSIVRKTEAVSKLAFFFFFGSKILFSPNKILQRIPVYTARLSQAVLGERGSGRPGLPFTSIDSP